MKNIVFLQILFFSFLFFIGCGPKIETYHVSFLTCLKNCQNCSLERKDSLLSFKFIPVPNGLWMRIYNLSDEIIKIDWDNSFFIPPNGNSTKAANTDLLYMKDELLSKSSNFTLIPNGAYVERFTTSVTEIEEIRKTFSESSELSNLTQSVSSIFSKLSTIALEREVVFDENAKHRMIDYKYSSIDSQIMEKKLFTYHPFWETEISSPDDLLGDKAAKIKDFIEQNNSLGLGLSVIKGMKQYTYRFDFEVMGYGLFVKIHNKMSPNFGKDSLAYFANRNDLWELHAVKVPVAVVNKNLIKLDIPTSITDKGPQKLGEFVLDNGESFKGYIIATELNDGKVTHYTIRKINGDCIKITTESIKSINWQ
ncbi:MAG: hypothetical protein LWX56_08750 [Ignavibacteria bacterium]|nr:hypothetical protein [Ignavibacteria bacterium]